MSTIVVKNLPEHLHARLKDRAEQNHRSMTKEVVHLIELGLDGSASAAPSAERAAVPSRAPDFSRGGRSPSIPGFEAAMAEPTSEAGRPFDGRAALRAALIRQPDGSYLNVLGVEDERFFETLDRIRREAPAPDVAGLFGDAS